MDIYHDGKKVGTAKEIEVGHAKRIGDDLSVPVTIQRSSGTLANMMMDFDYSMLEPRIFNMHVTVSDVPRHRSYNKNNRIMKKWAKKYRRTISSRRFLDCQIIDYKEDINS